MFQYDNQNETFLKAFNSIASSLERMTRHSPAPDVSYEQELDAQRKKHNQDIARKNQLINHLRQEASSFEACRNDFINARAKFGAEAKKNEEDLATARLLGPTILEKERKDDAVAQMMVSEISAIVDVLKPNVAPDFLAQVEGLAEFLARWLVPEEEPEEKEAPPPPLYNRSQAMDVAPEPPIMSDDEVAKMLEASRSRPKCIDPKCPVARHVHSHATDDGQYDEKSCPPGESGSLTRIGGKE